MVHKMLCSQYVSHRCSYTRRSIADEEKNGWGCPKPWPILSFEWVAWAIQDELRDMRDDNYDSMRRCTNIDG